MITHIDHIAIAVQNLETALDTFCTILGVERHSVHIEAVASEKVRVACIPLGASTIELLEPLEAGSPIEKFLATNGDGLHHIALATTNIDDETARLSEAGIKPLSPPKEGAEGKRIVFLHPKQTNRVLLECTQKQG